MEKGGIVMVGVVVLWGAYLPSPPVTHTFFHCGRPIRIATSGQYGAWRRPPSRAFLGYAVLARTLVFYLFNLRLCTLLFLHFQRVFQDFFSATSHFPLRPS